MNLNVVLVEFTELPQYDKEKLKQSSLQKVYRASLIQFSSSEVPSMIFNFHLERFLKGPILICMLKSSKSLLLPLKEYSALRRMQFGI